MKTGRWGQKKKKTKSFPKLNISALKSVEQISDFFYCEQRL